MTPQEEALFNRARTKIEEQQDLLKQLTAPAYHVGVVVAIYEKSGDNAAKVVVDSAGQLFELDRPAKDELFAKLAIGMPVDIHPQTGQIVKLSSFVAYGATGTVAQVDGKLVQINLPQGLVTTEYSMIPVAVGDKVVMNSSNHVILKKIRIESRYAFKTQSVLNWSDIGACEDAKKELIAALETPYAHPDVFSFFNKDQIKGALLWGRPGNGKTLLGRAAAGALARMHSKEAQNSGFIYIRGPEILDKFVGETESQIREAFTAGKNHFKRFGYPAVIFVDEADAILMRRGSRTASGMEMTIVPQFLSEMDGIEDSGVFVLLATNRADTLDPAVIRPGRVDRRVYVAPPSKTTAPEIWDIHLRRAPMAKGVSKEQVIQATNDALYSDQYPLYYIDSSKGRSTFSLGNLVSGAIIAGVVERASAIAIDRNIEAQAGIADPKKYPPLDGLRQTDFDAALVAMQKEQYGMNHFDELREFIDLKKLEVTNIEQCHTGQKLVDPKRTQQTSSMVAIPIPMKKDEYDA